MTLIDPGSEHRRPKHLGERIDPLWLPLLGVLVATVVLVLVWSVEFPASPVPAAWAPIITTTADTDTVPPPAPPTTSTSTAAPRASVWSRLADCESGEWDRNAIPIAGSARWDDTRDSYFGGLHFTADTWTSFRLVGFPATADAATPDEQIAVAERVLAVQGWNAWPGCSHKLNLTGGRP